MSDASESILIVDDDPHILELIEIYLQASGFIVVPAANGKDALAMFKEIQPQLVLTDLNMPTMSGIELLELIKDESPDTPVVIISGEGDMSDAIKALRLGASDYLIKPFTKISLEHAVFRALDRFKLLSENKAYRIELENKNIQLARNLEQLEADQNAGKNVQQLLLPKDQFKIDGYVINYKIIPSLYLSGDFVDYFKVDADHIVFYIADVSGHGASSAFITVMLKGLVEKIQESYEQRKDEVILQPDKVLKIVSDSILNAKLGKYLTMIYCVLNTSDNTLLYSVGGHYPSPILWDGQKAHYLEGKGFAVGIHASAKFETRRLELPLQFTLVLLSDGIFELMHEKNLVENEKQLLTIVQNACSIEEILKQFGIHDKTEFPDDISLLMMNKDILHERAHSGVPRI
jgi:serine phosphatase RsbU (regulator of sigma subunit)